jgi:hypothetical protein
MKKIIMISGLIMVLCLSLVMAAKVTDTCNYIKGGKILDTAGQIIGLGYDAWGYNYEAHMFNGLYANYGRPAEIATGGDRLMMKWSDTWLSNKDCNKDLKLDRGFSCDPVLAGNSACEGAWLTNHASGQYEGSNYVFGALTGQYVLSFVLGGTYNHDVFLTNTGGALTGNGGYPVGGPYSYTWDIISGAVAGNTIDFDAVYTSANEALGTLMHVTGTIQPDGTVSGTWNDNYLGGYREGTWSSTGMTVKETCYWNDFVKIIAVPTGAVLGLDGNWYTPENVLIGPSIWGSFAIIQEVSENPCGETSLGLMNFKSDVRSGLGNW